MKRFATAYPLSWSILKWSVLSLSLATYLSVTGVLAAIPVILLSGAFGIGKAAPILGGAMAALWYKAIKPASLWMANGFFYPMYSMRKLAQSDPKDSNDSPEKMLNGLGGTQQSSPSPEPKPAADLFSKEPRKEKQATQQPSAAATASL